MKSFILLILLCILFPLELPAQAPKVVWEQTHKPDSIVNLFPKNISFIKKYNDLFYFVFHGYNFALYPFEFRPSGGVLVTDNKGNKISKLEFLERQRGFVMDIMFESDYIWLINRNYGLPYSVFLDYHTLEEIYRNPENMSGGSASTTLMQFVHNDSIYVLTKSILSNSLFVFDKLSNPTSKIITLEETLLSELKNMHPNRLCYNPVDNTFLLISSWTDPNELSIIAKIVISQYDLEGNLLRYKLLSPLASHNVRSVNDVSVNSKGQILILSSSAFYDSTKESSTDIAQLITVIEKDGSLSEKVIMQDYGIDIPVIGPNIKISQTEGKYYIFFSYADYAESGIKYFHICIQETDDEFNVIKEFKWRPEWINNNIQDIYELENGNLVILVYYGIHYLYIAEIELTPVSVKEYLTRNANISLYPNPTRDILHIRTDELIARAELSDLLGNVVISHTSDVFETSDVLKINIENLPTGMYFVKLYTMSGEVLVEKVLIGF
jgi:hypothetical protein